MLSKKKLDLLALLTTVADVMVLVIIAVYDCAIFGIFGECTAGSVADTITTIMLVFLAQTYAFIWGTIFIRSWYQGALPDDDTVCRWIRIAATVCAFLASIVPFFDLITHPLQHLRNIITSNLVAAITLGIFVIGVAGAIVVVRMLPTILLDYGNWLSYNDQRYAAGESEVAFQDLYRHAIEQPFER